MIRTSIIRDEGQCSGEHERGEDEAMDDYEMDAMDADAHGGAASDGESENEAVGAHVLVLEEVDEPVTPYVPPPARLSHPKPGWTKSPSGRVIACVTDGPPDSTVTRAIEVLDPGMSAPRRFAPDFSLVQVAWSPDGTRLVATEHGRVHVVNLDDFTYRTLTWPREAPCPVFLDDERLVLSVAGALTVNRFGKNGELVEIDCLEAPRHVLGAHLGRYLVEINSGEPSFVYGFRDGRLALLGCFTLDADADAFARYGELRIENLEEDIVYRIVGLSLARVTTCSQAG